MFEFDTSSAACDFPFMSIVVYDDMFHVPVTEFINFMTSINPAYDAPLKAIAPNT
jgi:hypothetical protein